MTCDNKASPPRHFAIQLFNILFICSFKNSSVQSVQSVGIIDAVRSQGDLHSVFIHGQLSVSQGFTLLHPLACPVQTWLLRTVGSGPAHLPLPASLTQCSLPLTRQRTTRRLHVKLESGRPKPASLFPPLNERQAEWCGLFSINPETAVRGRLPEALPGCSPKWPNCTRVAFGDSHPVVSHRARPVGEQGVTCNVGWGLVQELFGILSRLVWNDFLFLRLRGKIWYSVSMCVCVCVCVYVCVCVCACACV